MQHYILRRLLLAVPTVGITVLVFLAIRVIPGDPLRGVMAEGAIYVLSDEELAEVRRSLGLDRPLAVQYFDWVLDILKGDLGFSFWRDKEPIRDLLLRRGSRPVKWCKSASSC